MRRLFWFIVWLLGTWFSFALIYWVIIFFREPTLWLINWLKHVW